VCVSVSECVCVCVSACVGAAYFILVCQPQQSTPFTLFLEKKDANSPPKSRRMLPLFLQLQALMGVLLTGGELTVQLEVTIDGIVICGIHIGSFSLVRTVLCALFSALYSSFLLVCSLCSLLSVPCGISGSGILLSTSSCSLLLRALVPHVALIGALLFSISFALSTPAVLSLSLSLPLSLSLSLSNFQLLYLAKSLSLSRLRFCLLLFLLF
jgi:hypothetical protein